VIEKLFIDKLGCERMINREKTTFLDLVKDCVACKAPVRPNFNVMQPKQLDENINETDQGVYRF
jgi:hypothetical protein